MDSTRAGLTDSQVEESRQQHGANLITPPPREPLWKQYLEKFSDPLIIILLVAGAFSLLISFYEYYGLHKTADVFFEPCGIFLAILLATGLAFIFEFKANREFSLLNQVNDDEPVMVIRNGNPQTIPRRDVVVGDLIVLSQGNEVPADAELLEAMALTLDESTLTGEPLCRKSANPEDADPEATFPTNHVLRGTRVMEGHGLARVFSVGDATENGKVFKAAQIDDSVKTPLNEQLEGLGDLITKASYIFAGLIIAGRLLIYFWTGQSTEIVEVLAYLLQSIMIAITLVVVAVPEGLPMAVTLSLAYSMRRMLQTNNLVRKMHACETMGATTVICTDKTGTLTCNQMSVNEFYAPDKNSGEQLRAGIALNSTAQLNRKKSGGAEALGNPTEGALLLWLDSQNVDYASVRQSAKIEAEVPFSTQRKYMAAQAELPDGSRWVYVKGAPEIVRKLCATLAPGLTDADISARLAKWQSQAMRTLGFACQKLKPGENGIVDGELTAKDLEFLAIVSISDPVRPDVPAAIDQCMTAGIQVKIVTGDTPGTAREIGRQIHLWTDKDGDRNIITGPELAALSEEELDSRVNDLKIIARARPLDKEKLVRSLQRKKQIVAVTGDGTNDAPALKAAHVGLSMGDGTSVAKEASDITILDNSFASIGRAVMWGRSLYQNIQRFILFQMTVNVAACFTVLVGAFMGVQSPLTVTQMLWVNLIMDTFAAMALASLPPREEVMQSPPRDREAFIISPPMRKRIIGVGGLFFLLLIGLVWYLEHYNVTSMTQMLSAAPKASAGLSPYECSMFFTIFVMLQFWNLFNAKAYGTRSSALHFAGAGGFLLIVALIFFGQVLIVTFGGQFFNVVPLSVSDWIWIILVTSPVLWLGEIARLFAGKEKGDD
ncbi:MAG: calcium-translocating P-type ATPase, PMCA-type [Desulfovibrio sp.]|nr:calcium-translocating P-type ATPase, PMCA-type [Desulfovibrio sp.]